MTTALLYALGVAIFVVAILVSIGLHELGHLIPAKKFGGKVTQYFVGFGPTVWSKQVGETEYGIKAIPLGGYVKIVGMLPPGGDGLVESTEVDAEGNPVHRIRKSNTGLFTQLISDARAAEWELVRPEDHDRLFYKLPWWKKVVVMAGGPSVNIAIAFLIFAGVFATFGNLNDARTTTEISEVQACVVPVAETGRDCVPADEPGGDPIAPAFAAGVEVGDRLVSFNGVQITDWDQVQQLIRANGGGEARLTVERDGALVDLVPVDTTVTARPVAEDPSVTQDVGFLGVSPVLQPTTGGPIYTVEQMGQITVDTLRALVTLPVKVFDVGQAIVGLEPRDPEGPVSIVGGGRLAGETTSHAEFPVNEKVVFLLLLIAGFNFFIGMFNFVPLLPLDGGHIASALWEAIRRGAARLRGRPDPGHVDAAKLLPVAYVVAAMLLVMGVVLIVGDIVVPLSLTG